MTVKNNTTLIVNNYCYSSISKFHLTKVITNGKSVLHNQQQSWFAEEWQSFCHPYLSPFIVDDKNTGIRLEIIA